MNLTDEELLSRLQNMDEYDFEELIADLWRKLGWSTTTTSGSNDGGIDVIAEKSMPFYQKQVIQAKRYSSTKVGGPHIQQYSSLKRQVENVDIVTIVTTGEFTSQAQDTANSLNVKTVNGDELVSIMNQLELSQIVNNYIRTHSISDFTQEEFNNLDNAIETCLNISRYTDKCKAAALFLDGKCTGYSVTPRYSDSDLYNVHAFLNEHNNIGGFEKGHFERIIKIATNLGLDATDYNENTGRLVVGREGSGYPTVDEMKSEIDEFSSSIFSSSLDGSKVELFEM